MHREVPMPSDRASLDGGTAFAPGLRASVPSVTHVRIPVRPRQRVRYAVWNNKSSSRVACALPDCRAPIIAAGEYVLGCFGLSQREVLRIAVEVFRGGSVSDGVVASAHRTGARNVIDKPMSRACGCLYVIPRAGGKE